MTPICLQTMHDNSNNGNKKLGRPPLTRKGGACIVLGMANTPRDALRGTGVTGSFKDADCNFAARFFTKMEKRFRGG